MARFRDCNGAYVVVDDQQAERSMLMVFPSPPSKYILDRCKLFTGHTVPAANGAVERERHPYGIRYGRIALEHSAQIGKMWRMHDFPFSKIPKYGWRTNNPHKLHRVLQQDAAYLRDQLVKTQNAIQSAQVLTERTRQSLITEASHSARQRQRARVEELKQTTEQLVQDLAEADERLTTTTEMAMVLECGLELW